MNSKKSETQQKTEVLAGYIDKQLAAGVKPKEVYEYLLEKKVPAEMVRELIEQAVKNRQPKASPAPAASDPKTDRRQKITNYIQAQLDAGKKPQEILNILIDKKVPREEAVELIRQVAKPPAPAQPQAEGAVSPDLPVTAILTPQAGQDSPLAFVAAQIDQGVDLKAIVDQLEAEGMPRNQAIDLVMDFNEKQKAELADPGLAKRDDLAIKGRNRMLIGLAALVGGGLITIASYSAVDAGGTYFLFYGPMIYGAIAVVSGLIQWLRNM